MSGMMLNFAGVSAASVPGAPTIGTATQTGTTTATVVYTAPANNGGSVITSYTAISTPSSITGTLSQAGSGTITVSGLAPSTSYTFVVFATNAVGNSANSAASNSITTAAVVGQDAYVTAGTYSWVAPAGVYSVSTVAIGAGGRGQLRVLAYMTCCGPAYNGGKGGGGGGLGYTNNISVSPNSSYTVFVGATLSNNGGNPSYFIDQSTVKGGGAGDCGVRGTYTGDGGGCGGAGGSSSVSVASGGGGAGGYGGNGGTGGGNGSGTMGGAGAAGGGGGGVYGGAGGGGGGILGRGSQGAGGTGACTINLGGGGGSGGTSGSNSSTANCPGGIGGVYGGGGGGGGWAYSGATKSAGGVGAVRIIYPGTTRSFPTTCTGNLP